MTVLNGLVQIVAWCVIDEAIHLLLYFSNTVHCLRHVRINKVMVLPCKQSVYRRVHIVSSLHFTNIISSTVRCRYEEEIT